MDKFEIVRQELEFLLKGTGGNEVQFSSVQSFFSFIKRYINLHLDNFEVIGNQRNLVVTWLDQKYIFKYKRYSSTANVKVWLESIEEYTEDRF